MTEIVDDCAYRLCYGAWDEPTMITPETCPKHNWYVSHLSNERLCVRCGERKPLPAPRIHSTAIVGSPPQWRGKEKTYPVDIHPTATVGAYTCIDAGCERPTIVGKNTQVMKQVHVGHGVQIGRGCDIGTGTVIAGEATIGNFVRVGIGALISPYVTVGDGSRIGAGAVVVKDIEDGAVVVGNPARVLRYLHDDEISWVLDRMAE